jgi:NADH-quinone oxidoreductase subunit C
VSEGSSRGGALAVERVKDRFPSEVLRDHAAHGDHTLVVRRERIVDICRFLKETPELAFEMLTDECGVDRLLHPEKVERFEVVLHLYSLTHNHRVRLRVVVPEGDPSMPTLTGLWKGADWFEREIWDMYGIKFPGHPDLRRLLLYDQFQGHPLRKDYPITKRQPIVGPLN